MYKIVKKLALILTFAIVLQSAILPCTSLSGSSTKQGRHQGQSILLNALNTTDHSVNLIWVTPKNGAGIYDIYRNNQLIRTIVQTVYSDTGLAPDTSYIYQVKAKNLQGKVIAESNILNIKTLPAASAAKLTTQLATQSAVQVENATNTAMNTNPSDLTMDEAAALIKDSLSKTSGEALQYVPGVNIKGSSIELRNPNFMTNRFIIKYKSESGKDNFQKKFDPKTALQMSKKSKGFRNSKFDKVGFVTLGQKKKLKDFVTDIKNKKLDSEIEYIQPDYEVSLSSNDPLFESQWGLKASTFTAIDGSSLTKTDLKSTTQDALTFTSDTKVLSNDGKTDFESTTANAVTFVYGAGVAEAWEMTTGSGAVVAVIDTGIDITHEDLADNIWTNTAEIPGNGLDDDNNGYIDDVTGWNFAEKTNMVFNSSDVSGESHGTHVAGIIAAAKDNEKGIAGVAPSAKIMPLKVFKGGKAYTSDIISAIEYAESMNVTIVNCSWGSTAENPALKEAMQNSNMLFVCAAGNSSINIDNTPIYPAAYDLENILSVASVNQDGSLSSFSNYGEKSVDVAAPGEKIQSSLPGNNYGLKDGTSMAAAFVSGEAALVQNIDNVLNTKEIRERIVSSSSRLSSLMEKINMGRAINFKNAVNGIYSNEIIQVTDKFRFTSGAALSYKTGYDLFGTSEKFKYNKYEVGQFVKNAGEDISIVNGSLNFTQNLLNLKGRNGLDLNLNIFYNSQNAGLYNKGYQLREQFYYLYNIFLHKSVFASDQVTKDPPSGYATAIFDSAYNVASKLYDSKSSAESERDWYNGVWLKYSNYSEYPYNYIVQNWISQGTIYQYYGNSSNIREDTTYEEKTANIGAGWNWGFSSIESSNESKYLHLSNGSTYQISITTNKTDDSNLKDYTLKDLRIENESGTYANSAISYSYVLYYKDGKRELFNNEGKLLVIVDRFDNLIKFEYASGQLSKITDTTGRVISFNYAVGTSNKTVTMSLSDPNASSIVLSFEKIPNYTNDYVLKSITDLVQRSYTFDYSYDNAKFNFFSRDNSGIQDCTNTYANLQKVTYPTTATTSYTYKLANGNLSNKGMQEYYRIETRKDNTEGKDYTVRTYNYSNNDYTGYSTYTDPSSLPESYTYTTTVTDGDNNSIISTFNSKHLLKNEQTKENGITLTKNVDYEYDTNKLPLKLTSNSYNKQGSYMQRISNYQYDDFADLKYSWSPLAQGNTVSDGTPTV